MSAETAVLAVTKVATDEMTTEEMIAIALGIRLNSLGPHIGGYEKALPLLTENGKMHEATKEAFLMLLNARINESHSA